MNNPLASIIIPVFNRVDLIGETLDSILVQTYQNWECIIIDDGSTDGTVELLNRYVDIDNRFKIAHRPDNRLKGANACRNIGFEISSGEYVNWFDSDDIMHSEMISKKAEVLINNPELDFVDCKVAYFKDEINNIVKRENWIKYKSQGAYYDHLFNNHSFLTPGPMFKRNFLDKKKLFNEKLRKYQEWEFFVRLFQYNPKFIVLPEELVYYRWHYSGSTRSLSNEVAAKYKAESIFMGYDVSEKNSSLKKMYRRWYIEEIMNLYILSIRKSNAELRSITWSYLNKMILPKIFFYPYFFFYLFKNITLKLFNKSSQFLSSF